MTTAVDVQSKARDWTKCRDSFLYFLWPSEFGDEEDKGKQFVFIEDTQLHKIVPLEPWPHLVEFARALEKEPRIVVIKSRQRGASWMLGAYNLWKAEFHDHSFQMEFSQGESDAKDLLQKSHTIWDHLPPHLKMKTKTDSTEMLKFETSRGQIRAKPSTAKAGHGATASSVTYDEFEYHQFAAESLMAVKPTVDAGGQMVVVSTVNKRAISTPFKGIVRDAMQTESGEIVTDVPGEGHKGVNGFRLFFWPYNVGPGRDEVWYEKTKREIPKDLLMELGLTPDLYMEQEYPRSLEEALSPSQAIAAFNLKRLDAMKGDCREPLRTLRNGMIQIYQDYKIGRLYAAFSDTSHGIGQDYNITVVRDVQSGYIVACIMNSRISPEELAELSVEMLKIYKEPLWGIEDNEWGILTIRTAQVLGYKNFFYREWQREGKRTDDDPEKLTAGWHTGTSKTHPDRLLLWGQLISDVDSGLVVVPHLQGLLQFYDVIRDEKGHVGAIEGGHDDFPLACGGAGQMAKYVEHETPPRVNYDTFGSVDPIEELRRRRELRG